MRRAPGLLVTALLTLVLTACGGGDTATDPAPTQQSPTSSESSSEPSGPSSQPTDDPTPEVIGEGPVPFTEVAMLTSTEEDGTVSTTPVPLESDEAVDEFVSQFTGSRLADEVRAAVATTPETGPGRTLVGAVVSIGCDRPAELRVERVDGAVQVLPVPTKNQVQCFAAQTTVAILVVDTVKLDPIVS